MRDEMKLSEAIRVGMKTVEESHLWLNNGCGCALSAAMVAHGYKDDGEAVWSNKAYEFLREFHPTLSIAFLDDVSEKHFRGVMNTEQIADWLETQGL